MNTRTVKNTVSRRGLSLLFLLLFIILAVIATLFLRQSVRDYLAAPILLGLKWMQQLAHSVDPDIFWGVLILGISAVILMSFPTLSGVRRQKTAPSDSTEVGGRLGFWQAEVGQLSSQSHFMRYSVVELRKLALSVIAFRQGCSLAEAEEWLDEHAWKAPDEVLELIHPESQYQIQQGKTWSAPAWLAWLFGGGKGRHAANSLSREHQDKVEIIIRYLEEQMEVKHEHRQ